LNIDNAIANAEVLVSQSLFCIRRLQQSDTGHLCNRLGLNFLGEGKVGISGCLDELDCIRVELLSVQGYLLKVLRLNTLEPGSNLLDLLLRNFGRIKVRVFPAVTRRVHDNGGDKLRELGHILLQEVYGLLAILPSVG
jgi:hypothetical protein